MAKGVKFLAKKKKKIKRKGKGMR